MAPRIEVWSLWYGLCVDVYHNEAWWEGVVFDQEDGCEVRLIFLPNSGTEIKIGIDMLRITQDWDLTTGKVKRRGKWLFLELVEELKREQEQPLGVSVKEMWLGVSVKEKWLAMQYEVNDWTCCVKPLLSELVSEAFKELVDSKALVQEKTVLDADLANSQFDLASPNAVGISSIGSITNSEGCSSTDFEADLLNFQVDLCTENPLSGGMVIGEEENGSFFDLNLEADLANSQVSLTTDNPLNNDVVIVDEGNEKILINPDAVGVTSIGTITSSGGGSGTDCKKIDEKPTKSRDRKDALNWQLAGPNIIGTATYCPNAVINYALNGTNPHDLAAVGDIRKHLSYLGWNIEYVKGDNDVFRFRYTSPDGKRYYSLVLLCQDLRESSMEIPPPISRDESASQNDIISSSSKDTNVCPQVKGILVIEPEHCPEAVVYWYLHGSDKKQHKEEDIKASDMILKVKKHLSFLRWVIWYGEKGMRRELRYTSPSGATYYSLKAACKACIDGGHIPEWLASREKLSSSTTNAKLQENFVPSNAKQSSSIPQSKERKTYIDGGQILECLDSSEKLSSSTANAKLQESSSSTANAKLQESFVPSNAKQSSSTANAKLQESSVPSYAKQSSSTPQLNKRKRDENASIHIISSKIVRIEEINE